MGGLATTLAGVYRYIPIPVGLVPKLITCVTVAAARELPDPMTMMAPIENVSAAVNLAPCRAIFLTPGQGFGDQEPSRKQWSDPTEARRSRATGRLGPRRCISRRMARTARAGRHPVTGRARGSRGRPPSRPPHPDRPRGR